MMAWKRRLIFAGILALAACSSAFAQGSERVVTARGYSSVDGVRPGDKFRIAVALEVAPGYHINAHVPSLPELYATKVSFEAPAGINITNVKYPASKLLKFEFFDKEIAVLEGTVYVTAEGEAAAKIPAADAQIRGNVTVQACNDSLCLGPGDLKIEIPIKIVAATQTVRAANDDVFAKAAAVPVDSTAEPGSLTSLVEYKGGAGQNSLATQLAQKGIVVLLLVVFLAGLGLNLTPCVYPIIPITIGFFINQSKSEEGKPRVSRAFYMASMYVLGMAATYSVLGVIAAKSGGLFGAALQSPIVLVVLAVLMLALSLSMFGVYEFKMPDALNRFATSSTQSTSGAVGALVMGLTMGIIAAPCVGPFVVALLVLVGERGDAFFGFLLFFVLALGLGLPYLLLGTFSASLPKSGLWMVTVRKVFGLILIGMALYFLMSLMGRWTSVIFATFFSASALYLIFFESPKAKQRQFAWGLRVIGIGAAVVAVLLLLPKKMEAEITWQPYSEQALFAAQKEGKVVIIDTFADWCISCKELDQSTFTDAAVKREAERFVPLKLDLTSNDPASEGSRARSKFGIRGLPTVLFLDPSGRELEHLRLEGFEKPGLFLDRMKQAQSAPAAALARNTADAKTAVADGSAGAADPAPTLSLQRLDGGTQELSALRGKVVLIDFWATWCLPCISEIPMFNELNRDYKTRGVEVVAVSLDPEGAVKVRPFLKSHPMDYTQTVGDASFAAAFDVSDSSLPVALLIDKRGAVRFRKVGRTTRAVLEEELNKLLNE
jgi:thioredoxin:protein disulfide reductase